MDDDERDRFVEAVVGDMAGVSEPEIQKRQIRHWFKADPQVGRRLAEGLDFDPEAIIADELLAVEEESQTPPSWTTSSTSTSRTSPNPSPRPRTTTERLPPLKFRSFSGPRAGFRRPCD